MLINKVCIVIVGSTAVGKTSLAIDLAGEFKTSIISADSRQCFRELNIGVAKPSIDQLEMARHYFINSHSIHDEVNAAMFEKYALGASSDIFRDHDTAIVVGGTGLYIKAFCEGMDEMPMVLPQIRNQVQSGYQQYGLEWLQNEVEKNDPGYYLHGEIHNPQRLMRRLEVKLSTGRPIRSFQTKPKKKRDFSVVKIGLQLSNEELKRNISHRVDEMIKHGLVEEVRGLAPYKLLNALNTVGYKEIFDYLDGRISMAEATDNIKKNTRQYAKRQLTWFKKDTTIQWFSPHDLSSIQDYCHHTIKSL